MDGPKYDDRCLVDLELVILRIQQTYEGWIPEEDWNAEMIGRWRRVATCLLNLAGTVSDEQPRMKRWFISTTLHNLPQARDEKVLETALIGYVKSAITGSLHPPPCRPIPLGSGRTGDPRPPFSSKGPLTKIDRT